ncbi:hypothetical protein QAD02_018975 [Eretmocerus hayati]|uniref:Uncharacterized protein n=1 Tax=Eretmocerus hayati TaxID=131215 RepID=A0ACC2PIA4_9HYME|nr:hypothetical protein QAD02_018975 [Eretmocerus hayati]
MEAGTLLCWLATLAFVAHAWPSDPLPRLHIKHLVATKRQPVGWFSVSTHGCVPHKLSTVYIDIVKYARTRGGHVPGYQEPHLLHDSRIKGPREEKEKRIVSVLSTLMLLAGHRREIHSRNNNTARVAAAN